MKNWLVIAAGVALLGAATVSLAQAQGVYGAPGYAQPGLPPYQIMSIVRSSGLTPVSRPVRRGPNYVLVAVDRAGRQMRVVVDARLGDIVNMRPAVAAVPDGADPYAPGGYEPGGYAQPPVYGAAPKVAVPPGAIPPRTVPPAAGAPVYGSRLSPGPYANVDGEPPVAAAPPDGMPVAPGYGARPAAPPRAGSDAATPAPAPRKPPASKLANAPSAVVPNLPDPPPPPLPRPRPKLAANAAAASAPSVPAAAAADAPIE